ncbi:MAG: hypothetical protein V3W52_02230 [Syntrophobacteria bacterium]|jgi:hypothetical protein
MEVKSVLFLVKSQEEHWEALRSTIGLGLENMEVEVFFLDKEIQMVDEREEEFIDNLEFLDEMDGKAYTDNQTNADRYSIEYLPFEDLLGKLPDYDLIVPF